MITDYKKYKKYIDHKDSFDLLEDWLQINYTDYKNMWTDCYLFVYRITIRNYVREISNVKYEPNLNDSEALRLIKEWIFLNLDNKLEDFELFIKNPDLHRDTNKYNL